MKLFKPYFFILPFLLLTACQSKSGEEAPENSAYSTKKIKIYLIGDSTCANKAKNRRPETGWGMEFGKFFNEYAEVENHALNGRSSKSFRSEGHWTEPILNKLQPGDYVFIQFGHNDQKFKSPDRYTNPFTGYRANLERYVNEVRSKGAHPILLSSIVRRNFNEHGALIDTHGEYPLVVRLVADDMHVPFLDLQRATEEFAINLGPEKSKAYWNHLEPGENKNYPKGVHDDTHLNQKGADAVAQMVVKELKVQNLLVSYLK
ncbi:MAG: rhamnogalacturonan acetylesterase [Mangrovibacterium sp.]